MEYNEQNVSNNQTPSTPTSSLELLRQNSILHQLIQAQVITTPKPPPTSSPTHEEIVVKEEVQAEDSNQHTGHIETIPEVDEDATEFQSTYTKSRRNTGKYLGDSSDFKRILENNKGLKDAILELKEELKSDEDISDLERQPTTPKENLLDLESELKMSDLNDLNYTSNEQDENVTLEKIRRYSEIGNKQPQKLDQSTMNGRKMSLEANEAIARMNQLDNQIEKFLQDEITEEDIKEFNEEFHIDSKSSEESHSQTEEHNEMLRQILEPKLDPFISETISKDNTNNFSIEETLPTKESSPNKKLRRRVKHMKASRKSKRNCRSASKLNALEKLIKIKTPHSAKKSRNFIQKSLFYSHRPKTDKISNILIRNSMRTHRSMKRMNQSIGSHLHEYSFAILEDRNRRFIENRIKQEIERQNLCTFRPNITRSSCNLNHNEYTGDILERLEQWVDYKERKINEMREMSELQFRDTHTFKPKIKKFSRSKSKKCFEPKRLSRCSSSYSEIGLKMLHHRKKRGSLSRLYRSRK